MARRGESIELAVLGLLHEAPMHGYELRKRLNLMLGWGRVLSYGSLYPALKKMLRAGWIEEDTATSTASRRPRITYRLTDAGDAQFQSLMSEVGPAAWEDDDFGIRFAFFGRTDMEIRLRVLEGRRTRLQERLARVQADLELTQAEVDGYAAELRRHGLDAHHAGLLAPDFYLSDAAERQAHDATGEPLSISHLLHFQGHDIGRIQVPSNLGENFGLDRLRHRLGHGGGTAVEVTE